MKNKYKGPKPDISCVNPDPDLKCYCCMPGCKWRVEELPEIYKVKINEK